MDLEGKTAVITGASRGIGAAVARMLHERGVNLGLCSRSGDDLGLDRAVAHACDVRDLAALTALCDATAARFGGIDILVANAGVGAYGPFLELSLELLDEMIDVNLKGTLYAVRAVLPHMLGREGDIVTLASEAGRRGLPYEAVYCASKFGQVGFTRALDHELREHGIRCTNVCPGGVATDFALEEARPDPRCAAGDDVRRRRRRGGRVRARAAAPPPHPRDGAATGEGGVMGLDAPVRWGIISTAHINRLADPGAHASEQDRPHRRREPRAGARRGVRATLGDRARIRLLRGSCSPIPTIEAVYISLPNMLHCEWSIRALEAGKHVLCEKPLSRHPADVEAAFDVADRTGRFLSEAFMYRHNPQTARLAELVARGAIGELRLVRSSFSYSLYDADNIRLRPDVEGGSLMDVGCYCVSGSRLSPASRVGLRPGAGSARPAPTGSFTGSIALRRRVLGLSTAAPR